MFTADTYTYIASVPSGAEEDGGCPLAGPSGLAFSETENELYIADPVAERVFVLDGDTLKRKRTLSRAGRYGRGYRVCSL